MPRTVRRSRVPARLSGDATDRGELARLVWSRMLELRLTQGDLAQRLGVTPVYVSRLLHGRDGIGLHALTRIAGALDGQVVVTLAPRLAGWGE